MKIKLNKNNKRDKFSAKTTDVLMECLIKLSSRYKELGFDNNGNESAQLFMVIETIKDKMYLYNLRTKKED